MADLSELSGKEWDREYDFRVLRWQLRRANKQMGNQGQTIYDLRCQVEELRAMIGKENRGYYRRLETTLASKEDVIQVLHDDIDRLREKISLLEGK